ncbi:hypothetical protein L195_g044052, partial [Trifolium pratense]
RLCSRGDARLSFANNKYLVYVYEDVLVNLCAPHDVYEEVEFIARK